MRWGRRAQTMLGSALELAGAGCVVAGVALVSVPAALIIGGLALIFVARGVAS
jgi:hypothetical protein